MKKILIFLLTLCIAAFSATTVVFAEEDRAKGAKSVYVTDGEASDELYSKNADERYPIASMVKIMTALICFETIENGELQLDDKITVSPNASGMGGSQMFLDTGLEYTVGDLIKGVIVVSANDACVALAERIAGSEEGFVELMNQKANELDMQNTHFANCTGLPASGGYSSAKDVAKMLSKLSKYDKYHEYAQVWLEDYSHPDGRVTTFTNTNKLIRFYQGCDGGKTGFTNEAGFCLAATAKRNGLRVISVVIGESNSKTRFADSSKLLDQAFGAYVAKNIVSKDEIVGELTVKGGKTNLPYGLKEDLTATVRRNADDEISVKTEFYDLELPITQGMVIGKMYAVSNGKILGEAEIYAFADLTKENYGDAVGRVLGGWNVKD